MYLQPVGTLRVLTSIHQDEHHVSIGLHMLFKGLGGRKSISSDPLGKVSQNNSGLRNLQLLICIDTSCKYAKIQILSMENGA